MQALVVGTNKIGTEYRVALLTSLLTMKRPRFKNFLTVNQRISDAG